MAQDPLKSKDSGKIGLPKVDGAMNKVAPQSIKGNGKGAKEPKRRKKAKPEIVEKPPLSDSTEDEGEIQQTDDSPEADSNGASAPTTKGPDMDPKEKSELLARIRKRMDRAISSESDNRKDALDDLKFKAGQQWPADVAAQRNFDRRPCLTVNKLKTFVHQITNDQRQNRPAINVSPVGDKGDPEVAKMFRGMIRSIERASSADIAYDTAFDGAVSNGFGYWRILTEYENPNSFNQVIVIKRIRNPFTVYLDDMHQEPDGSDAKWGFVTEMVPRDEFTESWPWADPMPYTTAGTGDALKVWVTQDSVRIAEYYEIQTDSRTLVALSNGHIGWKDELTDEVWEQIDTGALDILKERESDVPKVMWYKVSGADVLEASPWPSQWIPIVKVIGDEIDVEGKSKLSGLIRDAKDPQRTYNYWVTSYTEFVALQPKAPFIMEEGQIEGHEQEWKNANIKNNPVLTYKGTNVGGKPAPPPQRQPFGGVPAGIQQAIQNSAQDMMATTGIRFDATMQERTNDESGRALRELRRNGDIGSFHYIDNLGRSLKHSGRILIDLIPKIYDTKRVLMILREDGTDEKVKLDPNQPQAMTELQQPNGKKLKIYNPTFGEYGVTVTIGPSYATKRIEAAESMMDFARALPNTAQLIADLIAKNQDWPGAEEMAKRLAKAVPANLLTPDQKDMTPQVQALLQSMDMQIKALTAERIQMMKELTDKQADRAIDMEKINREFEAKLLKIVADVETKTAATQEKAVASFNAHIGSKLTELGEGVTLLMQQLAPRGDAPGAPGLAGPTGSTGQPSSGAT